MTGKVLSVTRDNSNNSCDKEGIPKAKNITKEEEEGLRSLKRR